MPALWFEPSERAPSPSHSKSWSGFGVSLLGHTLLIGALIWAGNQWVPVSPPQAIEVMLVEMPEDQNPTAALIQVQAPPQTPAQQRPVLPKPPAAQMQPVMQPKAKLEPAKPSPPAPEQTAEINTGEKSTQAPPNPIKNTPAPIVQTTAEPNKSATTAADTSREVSPARVDARYASTNPRPQYPSMARRLGQEGTVVLEVIVSIEGLAKSVRIQESSGHELLDQAALQAISKWKFVPAKRGELPIEQKLTTRWTYKLEQ